MRHCEQLIIIMTAHDVPAHHGAVVLGCSAGCWTANAAITGLSAHGTVLMVDISTEAHSLMACM